MDSEPRRARITIFEAHSMQILKPESCIWTGENLNVYQLMLLKP